MGKGADGVIRIPCKADGNFFKYWFEFLQPFHNLTEREMEVITAFVRTRYKLSKVITDPEVLDQITMNEDTKRKVREECNISPAHFQVIMGKFRKNRIIIDGKINPKFIPNMDEDTGSFKLMLFFEFQ